MKTLVERVKEQETASKQFTEENFGLQVGDGFPELARELLADEHIIQSLVGDFLITVMSGPDIARRMQRLLSAKHMTELAKLSALYRQPFTWLYWGIEIGRQLEREAAATPVAQ